jgi:hypothetical protein
MVPRTKTSYLKGTIDFLSDFGASEHNLSRDEDQQNDLWVDHSIDQTREQFRFVRREHAVAVCQTLQSNGESNITAPDDILDLKVHKLGVETKLLDDPGVLAWSEPWVVFRLCASDNHLARGKDQRRRLGVSDSHNHRCETLQGTQLA